MSETIVRRGHDTWANIAYPNREYGAGGYIQLKANARRGFVYMPLAGIRGRTVLSATLSMHVRGTWAAQELTIRAVASSWAAATLNWNNQPGVTGATSTVTTGALSAGAEITVDVTTQVQQVANGVAWYGFRVGTDETSTAQKLASFDSGLAAWTLTVELSDIPEQPSGLAPDGGAVSSNEPILSWDFTDATNSAVDQAALQVQADPAADGVSPNFDSGTVVSTEPELDLSTTAYVGPASGGSDQWRVRVQSDAGDWSEWSDWATFTYEPKPALSITEPSGSVIYDPTPPVEASITGGTLRAWRIVVTKGTDRTAILYNSGVRQATDPTDIALTIPERNDDGIRIFRDDVSYQIGVRIWDDIDRAPGVTDDPTWVEAWKTVTFDDDVAVAAPAGLTVTQVGVSPRLQFTWTRSVTPDAWVITRNGKVYARLDDSEVPESPADTYTWVDGGYSNPYEDATWKVKAVVANRQSVPSNAVVQGAEVEGVWLITAAGQSVVLNGVASVDGFKTLDRRATYKPINVAYDVDILTGLEGASGAFDGACPEAEDQSVATALAVLEAIKDAPEETVQMVWASKSVPVRLRHLTFLPASEFKPENHQHNVSFEFWQVGDFDHEVG